MSGRGKLTGALLAALVVALGVGWPVVMHYRLKGRVEEYKRQLRARGEKLAIADLTPARHPHDRQGIQDFLATLAQLRPFMYASNFPTVPPTMRYVAPGRALVAWQQEVLPTYETTNVWPALKARLPENQEGLADLRAALQQPILTFDLDYSQSPNVPFLPLTKLKEPAYWLSWAATLDLHEGRVSEAWANLKALCLLVEWDREEPLVISVLVRIVIYQIAINMSWEALQSPDLGEAQLRELQAIWGPMEFLSQTEAALAMDRAMSPLQFAQERESYSRLHGSTGKSGLAELAELGQNVLDSPREGAKALLLRFPGYWAWKWWQSYDDELADTEALQACLEAVRSARRDRAIAPARKGFDEKAALISRAHPGAGTVRGYSWASNKLLHNLLTRVSAIETERALLITAIALNRYHLKRGVYPVVLTELTPDFLLQPPLDPMDGQPLRYRLKPDGTFLLYSVGEDGHDDGGDPTPTEPATRANKGWWRGVDAVWPWPATKDEIAADFEKVAGRRDVAQQIRPLAASPTNSPK